MGRPRKDRPAFDPDNLDTWPTRADVAKALHVSVFTVRGLEGRRLHPKLDTNGVHRFHLREVHALEHDQSGKRSKLEGQPLTRGEVEAQVFKMLDAQRTRREIVTALMIPAEEVQRIWELWRFETCEEAAQDRRRREKAETERKEEAERDRERRKRLELAMRPFGATQKATQAKP